MNRPKVLVVGDPRFADMLINAGANWDIQPAVSNVNAMWDAIEAGTLSNNAEIAFFSDGTGQSPDELESTLAAFAPFATVFVVAAPERATRIIDRAKQVATAVPNGDPNAPLHALPMHDVQAAYAFIRATLGDQLTWNTPATDTPAANTAPAAPAPAAPAAVPAPATPSNSNYEQGTVYAAHVAAVAAHSIPKPHGARPGQITIASMSSKGGSGKSTTAALLAGTIARSSAAAGKPLKVVLVDLDTRDGQVGSLIGKYMPTSINIRVMPEWNADTVTANLVHDPRLGIDALLAPVRPRNADDVGPDFYRHVIGVLQTTHDVVILDCSVNYLDPLLGTAFAMSDEILFVTTLATTSVQGMARSLTELFADPADGGLGIPQQKVGIVANQVIKNVGMGKDKLLRAALGAPLVGQIPSDQDAVLLATNGNKMADLLKHPRLGPAFFRLAVNCLPNTALAPITSEQVAAARDQQAEAEKKRGLFRK